MPPSRAVAEFRARFRPEGAAERDERAATPDQRLREALELHGLALWMDIERAMRDLGAELPEQVVDEVNRRRLASSPMPEPLAQRWRALRGT